MTRILAITGILLAAAGLRAQPSPIASHGVILAATNATLIPRCQETEQRKLTPGDLIRSALAKCPDGTAKGAFPAETVVIKQGGSVSWAICGAEPSLVKLTQPGSYRVGAAFTGFAVERELTAREANFCANTGSWLFDEVLDAGVQSFQRGINESLLACSKEQLPSAPRPSGSELQILSRAAVAEAAARRKENPDLSQLPAALNGYGELHVRWPGAGWINHKLTQLELIWRLSRQLVTQKQSQTVGISIGISDFLGNQNTYMREKNLPLPANDAEAFNRYLKELNVKSDLRVVRGVRAGQPSVATLARILATLSKWACQGGGPNSTAVVFVTSHGFENDSDAYIVPEDGFAANPRITAISARQIATALSTFQRSFLFVDACRTQKAQPKFNAISSYLQGLPSPAGKMDFLLQSTAQGSVSDTSPDAARARCGKIPATSPLSCTGEIGTGNGDFTFNILSLLPARPPAGSQWKIKTFVEALHQKYSSKQAAQKPQWTWLNGSLDDNVSLDFATGPPPTSHAPVPAVRFVPAWFQQNNPPDADLGSALELLRQRIAKSDFRLPDVKPAQQILAMARTRTALRPLYDETHVTLEDAGQMIIRRYLEGDEVRQPPEEFERCAALYELGQAALPDSTMYQSRRRFCEARARIETLRKQRDLEARRRSLENDILPLLWDAQRLDPEAAYTLNAMGIAYLESGRYEEARRAFSDAVQRQPEWAYPRHNLALTYMQAGRMRDSVAAYREAQERAPNYSYLRYNHALVQQRLNRLSDAAREYAAAEEIQKRTAALYPSDARRQRAQLYNAWGTLLAQQGKRARARSFYERAKAEMKAAPEQFGGERWFEPDHNLALLGKGAVRLEALDALAKSTAFLPTRLALADLLLASKAPADHQKAAGLLEAVVQDQPLFPGAFLSLAELHRRAGQLDEARKNAEAAEKLSPNGWEARLALARIATAGGRGADALRLRDETLLLAGENEPARKRIRKTWNKK